MNKRVGRAFQNGDVNENICCALNDLWSYIYSS